MNDTTAHPLPTARRFGESLSAVASDLDVHPRDAWKICDAVSIARTIFAPDDPVPSALVMAELKSASARCLAVFYALVLDTWPISPEEHDAILRLVDPSFCGEWAND